MRADRKLKKISFIVCIISLIVLITSIIQQTILIYKEDMNIKKEIFWAIIIAVSSGVFGSSFVLWFTKKFDIKDKQYDLYVDYFFAAYKLTNIISNLQPFLKADDVNKVIKSYQEVDQNRNFWAEMQKNYRKLEVVKDKNKEMQIIKKINDIYLDKYPKIVYNIVCVQLSQEDAYYSKQSKECEKVIFNCIDVNKTIEYWPFTNDEIIPELQELDRLLFGYTTIKQRAFPNAKVINDEN